MFLMRMRKRFFTECQLITNVLNHLAAIKRSSSSRAKNIFCLVVLAAVQFLGATIKMPEIAAEINSSRINNRRPLRILSRFQAQQFAAEHSCSGIAFPGLDQLGNEIRAEDDI